MDLQGTDPLYTYHFFRVVACEEASRILYIEIKFNQSYVTTNKEGC